MSTGTEIFSKIKHRGFHVERHFTWKTSVALFNVEEFLEPKDMRTSHMFYTLRMIWNNSCPASMRVGKVKLYNFSSHYTPNYMANAVYHIGNELGRRHLESWMEAELMEMAHNWASYVNSMRNGIEK